MHLTIIGGGRAAWAFGTSWLRAGWVVDHVVLRPASGSNLPELLSADRLTIDDPWSSETVLVAVPDDSLSAICAVVAEQAAPDAWLFHPSGSHDSSLFGGRPRTFSLHPLRALTPAGQGGGLADALLVFEGDDASKGVAREIATRTGARFATIKRERKPVYHAAAVISANLVAAQLDVASSLMSDAGIDVPDIRAELADLARSAISNWLDRDGAGRFTGPIARGDVDLVRQHLESLTGHDDAGRIYRTTSLALCRKLLAASPEDPSLREIEALLIRAESP